MPFTFESPEKECFWRILDAAELAVFTDISKEYGLPKPDMENFDAPSIKELLKCKKELKEKFCIRCRPCRDDVLAWKAKCPGGMILRIDKAKLDEKEYEIVEGLPDAYLVGSAARRAGNLEAIE